MERRVHNKRRLGGGGTGSAVMVPKLKCMRFSSHSLCLVRVVRKLGRLGARYGMSVEGAAGLSQLGAAECVEKWWQRFDSKRRESVKFMSTTVRRGAPRRGSLVIGR